MEQWELWIACQICFLLQGCDVSEFNKLKPEGLCITVPASQSMTILLWHKKGNSKMKLVHKVSMTSALQQRDSQSEFFESRENLT